MEPTPWKRPLRRVAGSVDYRNHKRGAAIIKQLVFFNAIDIEIHVLSLSSTFTTMIPVVECKYSRGGNGISSGAVICTVIYANAERHSARRHGIQLK